MVGRCRAVIRCFGDNACSVGCSLCKLVYYRVIMPFVGVSRFLNMLYSQHVCFIGGAYGTGKTLLSVALGVQLWADGFIDHIYSNFRLNGELHEDIPDPGKAENSVVIFDEAWQELDSRNFKNNNVMDFLAFLRKQNNVLLSPSVAKVDIRARSFDCRRVWSFRNLVWMYGFGIISAEHPDFKRDRFLLINPWKYFCLYNHKERPTRQTARKLRYALMSQDDVNN